MEFSQLASFCAVALILYIGDAVSQRSRAWFSSMFVSGMLFLVGYWFIFPIDLVERTGMTPALYFLLTYLLIVNMGTLLSFNDLKRQFGTVIVALIGITGLVLFAGVAGLVFFDWNTTLVAIPPLVGGIVSTIIMSDGALAKGLDQLSVLAIVLFVLQGFAGYPLTSLMLKREGRRLLQEYRSSEHVLTSSMPISNTSESLSLVDEQMPNCFKWMPPIYNTAYFKLLRVGLVAYLAYWVSNMLAPLVTISPFVLCLVFGVIASSLGFLERNPLKQANTFGFTLMCVTLFIFDGLKRATPEMLFHLLYPVVILISFAVLGMYLFSMIASRIVGTTKEFSFAISLTALYGFPADYIITNEVIQILTPDEKERNYLIQRMLSPMLVGGFVSVTFVSVILAGIFVEFLT